MSPPVPRISGPSGFSLLRFGRNAPDFWLNAFVRLQREHGDIVALRLGRRRTFLVSDPALIHQILAQAKTTMKERGLQASARLFLGDGGLLTSQGETYKQGRQLARPALHPNRMAAQAAIVRHALERTQAAWRDGSTIELADEASDAAMRIASEGLLGVSLEPHLASLRASLFELGDFGRRAVSRPFYFFYQHLPLPRPTRFRRARDQLNSLIEQALATASGTPSWLGHLRAESTSLNPAQVRDLAKSILLAGQETTASALTWIFYLLSNHSEIERRVLDEVRSMPGGTDSLPYTLQVVRESMRLYPPVWTVGREALTDLNLGPLQMRRGDTAYMSQYVVHRDARHFPDPERFDPDRFAPGALSPAAEAAYFPFGLGPRACIGEQFALQTVSLAVQSWLPRWRFRLARPEPVGLDAFIALKPLGGMRMTVVRRTNEFQSS